MENIQPGVVFTSVKCKYYVEYDTFYLNFIYFDGEGTTARYIDGYIDSPSLADGNIEVVSDSEDTRILLKGTDYPNLTTDIKNYIDYYADMLEESYGDEYIPPYRYVNVFGFTDSEIKTNLFYLD